MIMFLNISVSVVMGLEVVPDVNGQFNVVGSSATFTNWAISNGGTADSFITEYDSHHGTYISGCPNLHSLPGINSGTLVIPFSFQIPVETARINFNDYVYGYSCYGNGVLIYLSVDNGLTWTRLYQHDGYYSITGGTGIEYNYNGTAPGRPAYGVDDPVNNYYTGAVNVSNLVVGVKSFLLKIESRTGWSNWGGGSNTTLNAFLLANKGDFSLEGTIQRKLHNFPFEEGQGSVTHDQAITMTGTVNADWTAGRIGGGLSFDGRATVCKNVSLTGSGSDSFFQNFDGGPFTLSCWIKPNSAQSYSVFQEILNTGVNVGPGWRLSYFYRKICFISGDGSTCWSVDTDPAIDQVNVDDWNHVAVVRDGQGILSIYLNGKKAAQSLQPFVITSAGYPVTIGAYRGGAAYGFNGVIDEVRLYNRALVSGEIYQIYRTPEDPLPPSWLNGTMTGSIWTNANCFSTFYLPNSSTQASVASIAKVTCDNQTLYVGFECSEPNMAALKKNLCENTMQVSQDDSVELMIDADASDSRDSYYHIVVNPLGYYGVERRTYSGQVVTAVRNFRCFTRTSLQANKWIVEVGIPFSSFVNERIHDTIKVNFARNRWVNLPTAEQSLCIPNSLYHQPSSFQSINLPGTLDLSPYDFALLSPTFRESSYDGSIKVKLFSRVTNNSSSPRDLTVFLAQKDLGVLDAVKVSPSVGDSLNLNFTVSIPAGGLYDLELIARDKQGVRYETGLSMDLKGSPIGLDVIKPLYRNTFFAAEQIQQIQARCQIDLPDGDCQGSDVVFFLTDSQNQILATRTVPWSGHQMLLTLDLSQTLSSGTYRLNCQVKKGGTVVGEQSTPIYKLSAPGTGNEVRYDDKLNIVVNNQIFFPISWWGSASQDMANTGSNGLIGGIATVDWAANNNHTQDGQYGVFMLADFSAINAYWVGQNALSTEAKNYITYRVNAVKNSPGLLYYYMVDEPEGLFLSARILEETYTYIRNLDPYHPIAICNNTVGSLYSYKNALDMFVPDPYIEPIAGGGLGRPMTYVSNFMEEAKKAGNGKKFIGVTPQVFRYGTPADRYPTYVEARCNQYLAIIHGARGLHYYIYDGPSGVVNDPTLLPQLVSLIDELKFLSPVIMNGETVSEVTCSSPNVHLLLKRYNGHLYLFAAHVNDNLTGSETVNFTFSEFGPKTFKAFSEDRNITAANNTITDSFGKYAVHVYTTNMSSSLGMPGDANVDGKVDVGDLGILAANYGRTGDAIWTMGDFNGDGKVDVGDLGILAAHYGEGSTNPTNFSEDYSKAFGTTVADDDTDASDDAASTSSIVCSGLGLPLIAGLVLMCLMLVKLEE
jgi:hypothetical protein